MKVICVLYLLLILPFGVLPDELSRNVSSRPAVVNIGAILDFDTTVGRASMIAIKEAVKDVNSNGSLLGGTKLRVHMQNSGKSGFLGMVAALEFMETDIVAVIGPQSSVVANVISFVADELQVPLLSFGATDPFLSSLQFPLFIRMTQSDLYQMTAVAEIVDYYGWRNIIAIFVDDEYGRNGVAVLDDELTARRCKISYKVRIPPGPDVGWGDIMDILVKVVPMGSRVIVLHTDSSLGFMVFSVAHYLEMMGDGYVWIATDWLSSELDSFSPLHPEKMDSMQGVLALRQHTPDSDRKKAFYSRWNKLTGGSIGLNTYALYAYDSVWLVAHAIDSFLNKGGMISFSNDSKLGSGGGALHLEAMSIFDGGKLLLKNIVQSDYNGLTGRIKFNPDKSLIRPAYDVINVIGTGFRQIGYWSSCCGLSTVPPETLYSRPANVSSPNAQLRGVVWPGETTTKPRGWIFPNSGKLLRIGVPNRVTYREFVSKVSGTKNFEGFCIDVFTAAVSMLPYPLPYEFISYGDGLKNPSYTKLVESLAAGNYDGVVGDISIIINRTNNADFTQPYAASGLVILAPITILNTGGWAFLRPFSPSLWGVTAAFFLVIGIVIWCLEHRINVEFRGPPQKQLITILWFSLCTLFFTHRENTVNTLGRVVLIVWLFVVLIINSSYTASLTSILTVQHMHSPIRGIETLIEMNQPIGIPQGSFARRFLVEEFGIKESMLKVLDSPEEYVEQLELGPNNGGVVAVIDERPYIDLLLSRHCSKFRIIGREFSNAGWGFAFRQGSYLAVDLSSAILTLSENGDLERIYDKWLTRSSDCSSGISEVESDRLRLESFWGIFAICGIACLVALFIFFLQIMYQLRNSADADSHIDGESNSRSRSLKKLLSLIDEKEDPSKRLNKRKKVEIPCPEDGTRAQIKMLYPGVRESRYNQRRRNAKNNRI